MCALLKNNSIELTKKVLELREKLSKLRFKKDKTHEIKLVKREIARVLTKSNSEENVSE